MNAEFTQVLQLIETERARLVLMRRGGILNLDQKVLDDLRARATRSQRLAPILSILRNKSALLSDYETVEECDALLCAIQRHVDDFLNLEGEIKKIDRRDEGDTLM